MASKFDTAEEVLERTMLDSSSDEWPSSASSSSDYVVTDFSDSDGGGIILGEACQSHSVACPPNRAPTSTIDASTGQTKAVPYAAHPASSQNEVDEPPSTHPFQGRKRLLLIADYSSDRNEGGESQSVACLPNRFPASTIDASTDQAMACEAMPPLPFVRSVAVGLVGNYQIRDLITFPCHRVLDPINQHMPERIRIDGKDKCLTCVVCAKKQQVSCGSNPSSRQPRRSTCRCKICKVALCMFGCFDDYHSKEKFWE